MAENLGGLLKSVTIWKPSIARKELRRQAMQSFIVFYFAALCPILAISMQRPHFWTIYGFLFTACNYLLGFAVLIYLRRTQDQKHATLILCSWSVIASVVVSLENELFYSPLVFWVPFLLTFVALQSGLKSGALFTLVTGSVLFAYFKVAPDLGGPPATHWPHWPSSVLFHLLLSQFCFYIVVSVFERLREIDHAGIKAERHRLMRNTRQQSIRSLNRLIEKRIQACADADRDIIAALRRGSQTSSKVTQKAFENLLENMESFLRMSDLFLGETGGGVQFGDFVEFLEEILREDPQFHRMDFQFKQARVLGEITTSVQGLLQKIQAGLEYLTLPWADASYVLIIMESQVQDYTLHFTLRAFTPQSKEGWQIQSLEDAGSVLEGDASWEMLELQKMLSTMDHSFEATAEWALLTLRFPQSIVVKEGIA